MTGIHFFDVAVQLTQASLSVGEVPLGVFHDQHHQHQTEQCGHNSGRSENPVGVVHHDQTADKLCHC